MYKIDIKEALYPIQIVLVVFKKFSKTSVFIDRKWPIHRNLILRKKPVLIKSVISVLKMNPQRSQILSTL